MKLIIDIPEEMHKQIKDGYVPLGISKYLKNGTPLDDVKAEIKKECDIEAQNHDTFDDYSDGRYDAFSACLKIIDKCISGEGDKE